MKKWIALISQLFVFTVQSQITSKLLPFTNRLLINEQLNSRPTSSACLNF